MTDKEFEAMAKQFQLIPMSPYTAFGWKEGTNLIKVRTKAGVWVDGRVFEIGSSFVVSIDDGSELNIPKTFIHPS